MSYFNSIGIFARITDTFVNQEITTARGAEASDGFSLVDLVVGFSFPKRSGQISFQVKNVFDEDFSYQGLTGIRTSFTKLEQLYYPETLFLVKCNLSF